MAKAEFLECGQIVGTHGIKGEVRINPWCDSPDFLLGFKKLYFGEGDKTALHITASRVHGRIVLAKIKGVNSIEEAEVFRGKTLYISRKDVKLEPGRHFISDLIGCKVFGEDETPYGELTDVSETGANDVWHITRDGKEYLIPVIPDVVKSIDVDKEVIIINPLKGIFDDED